MPFLSPSILKVYGIIPYYLLLLYSYTTIWHDLDSSLYILYDQRPTDQARFNEILKLTSVFPCDSMKLYVYGILHGVIRNRCSP